MAFLEFPNVAIVGISACVPKEIEENLDSTLATKEELVKIISSIGVERKRVAPKTVCTSDLCFESANKLINELGWNKQEIEALVFVTQTPDYILPATSCVLQERLGLSNECLSFDVSLGCSGWVYGMSVISSLLSNGNIRKALLLCGDTTTRTQSYKDKTSYLLFGDAGTCTALEYNQISTGVKIHLSTDGSGKDAILISDGGYRNGFNENSLKFVDYGDGEIRNGLHAKLDGMSVFSFAINKAPKSVNMLCDKFLIDKEKIDCFVFHQANLFLNEKIRTKLKIPENKVPYSLKDFGNSSAGTIPITLVTEWKDKLINSQQKIIACAFGVGLSWGSIYFETNELVVPDLIEY